jgi:hypothetical protein
VIRRRDFDYAEDQLINAADYANRHFLQRNTVRQWVRRGKVTPARRIERVDFFTIGDLDTARTTKRPQRRTPIAQR